MATYRVTSLTTDEVELLNASELQARFAPGLIDGFGEWLDVFLATPVIQKGHGVKTEKLDPKAVFEEAELKYEEKREELAKAKTVVDEAVAEILVSITEEELEAGAIYKISEKSEKQMNIVEYWVRKGKPNLAGLMAAHENDMHINTLGILETIQAERKQTAEKRKK